MFLHHQLLEHKDLLSSPLYDITLFPCPGSPVLTGLASSEPLVHRSKEQLEKESQRGGIPHEAIPAHFRPFFLKHKSPYPCPIFLMSLLIDSSSGSSEVMLVI